MVRMIDIGSKKSTQREAIVAGRVSMKTKVIALIREKKIPKGDVLEAARIAGIFAAKKTANLIPLCHPINIDYIEIDFSIMEDSIEIISVVRSSSKTGVEMEAFTATSVAAITIYDMCKSFDRGAYIADIRLLKKTGGKSDWSLFKSRKSWKKQT